MKPGLGPQIDSDIARNLLDIYVTYPEIGQRAFHRLLGDYRDQMYEQMLVAGDDQLAGYRGMLLAINNLLVALHPDQLRKAIDKAKKPHG